MKKNAWNTNGDTAGSAVWILNISLRSMVSPTVLQGGRTKGKRADKG